MVFLSANYSCWQHRQGRIDLVEFRFQAHNVRLRASLVNFQSLLLLVPVLLACTIFSSSFLIESSSSSLVCKMKELEYLAHGGYARL